MSDVAKALVEKALNEKKEEIEAKVGTDLQELQELEVAFKKLNRGSGTSAGPAISDQTLIEAVSTLEGPSSSPAIAEFLGVDVRKISRKLAKLATDGAIVGNKDDGYSAA